MSVNSEGFTRDKLDKCFYELAKEIKRECGRNSHI